MAPLRVTQTRLPKCSSSCVKLWCELIRCSSRVGGFLSSPYPASHLCEDAVHHLVAIVQCELLRPVQVADIGRKCRMALRQIREVAVGKSRAQRRADLLRHLDVVAANL